MRQESSVSRIKCDKNQISEDQLKFDTLNKTLVSLHHQLSETESELSEVSCQTHNCMSVNELCSIRSARLQFLDL